MEEMVKKVVSTHPEEVEREPDIPRREAREILVGRIVIPIDRVLHVSMLYLKVVGQCHFPMLEETLMPP